ncbi:MAG: gamma-glutamyltransferase, partial [Pseudomonadota bacterium]|nr:gamma-glutamyltransferase [Pseudomonadota bacterium]
GRIHHQWLPDSTSVETNTLSPDTIRLYKERGHSLTERSSQGAAMGVYHDRGAGLFLGASDSRRDDGAAVGY